MSTQTDKSSRTDEQVVEVLDELRPHLPPALRRLPNEKLLVLVNWHVMAAWERTIQEFAAKRPASASPVPRREASSMPLWDDNARPDP